MLGWCVACGAGAGFELAPDAEPMRRLAPRSPPVKPSAEWMLGGVVVCSRTLAWNVWRIRRRDEADSVLAPELSP